MPTRTAAEHYGLEVSRSGMALCPFHDDHVPSLKLDERFHCFGCQADGDVIDFTARLFGLSLREAAFKLAADFGIAYDHGGQIYQKPPSVLKELAVRQERQEQNNRAYGVYCRYLHLLRDWLEDYSPQALDEDVDARFVEACHRLPYVEYWMDTFLDSDETRRTSLVKESAETVNVLEQRLAGVEARRQQFPKQNQLQEVI